MPCRRSNAPGHMPLPPYIRRPDEPRDRERYQTVFARAYGAVAAPTAGLHFTPAILDRIRNRGAEIREITLEVGLGTFQPVREERLEDHRIHAEAYEIPAETAEALAAAKRGGRRVLAVGTTVVRTLEDAAVKAMATRRPEWNHLRRSRNGADFHTSRTPICRGRSITYEFSLAPLDLAGASGVVRGPRSGAGGLPPRCCRGLPIL